MANIFNPTYTDAELQGTAATVSQAFDNSAQIQNRTRARYGLPALANFQKDWAIERARSVSDTVNRMRMMRSLTPEQRSNSRARANGLSQLASVLLGRDQYNKLMQGGLIQGMKDIFSNSSRPGVSPTGQQELDAAGLYNERGSPIQEVDAAGLYNERGSPIQEVYPDMYYQQYTFQQPDQVYPDVYYQQETYQPEYVAPAEVMPDVFYQSEG